MDKEEINELLSGILRKEREPLDVPSEEDWEKLKEPFDTEFSPEFIHFINSMAFFSFPGEILNVRHTGRTNGNDPIITTYNFEKSTGRWPTDMIPFYAIGNGDYFCLSAREGMKSAVYYYYHENGVVEKNADSFEEWLRDLPKFLNSEDEPK